MSRTYIGPFGRILPIPDDEELEQQQLPVDETRTNMTTYQLPPPERLQFGSDSSSGFTEPMRYNTISQSSQTRAPSNPVYADQIKHIRHEQLPSVRQLLTPATQSSVPASPFSPQRGPNPSRRPPNLPPDLRGSQPDQAIRGSEFPFQPTHYSQPQLSTKMPPPNNVTPSGASYQISPLAQQFVSSYTHHQGANISPYAHSFETPQQMSYASQHQQALPPNLPQHQQMALPNSPLSQQAIPPNASSSQQILTVDVPTQYYQEHLSNHEPAANPRMTLEQSPPASASGVKALPRVVGEQDVPGEGPSWVYEDGTTCKKVIDGEAVNAQWGVTKAGKPRKRLAIACTTCREKKIKCDPAEPKCVQCEKFGRECRFTTAFRIQRGNPDSSSYDFQAHTALIRVECETPPAQIEASPTFVTLRMGDQRPLKRRKSSPETCNEKLDQSTDAKIPLSKVTAAKKKRSSYPGPILSGAERKTRILKCSNSAPDPGCPSDGEPAKPDIRSFSWCSDPFDIDGDITGQYLELYFANINNVTYQMFPRKIFLGWARRSERKSPEDLMIMYAMLAVGSIFSSRPNHKLEGSLFANIAKHAVEKTCGRFTLQLTHSMLLLALYYFSMGEAEKSWGYGGMAIRAASGLKLNLEKECQNVGESEKPVYGINEFALAECRRRTFWSAYMLDRFSSHCSGHMCMIHSEDVFLRVPCEEKFYEEQEYVETPFYNNGLVDQTLCQSTKSFKLGSMARCVQVTSIWSDISASISRSSHTSDDQYMAYYQSFYDGTCQKLNSWRDSLSSKLTTTDSEIAAWIRSDLIGSFVSLHAIYHAAIIRLNRNVRHVLLPASVIARNVKTAVNHATQLLQLIQKVEHPVQNVEASCPVGDNPGSEIKTIFTSPFIGYAMFTAIDVLSAGGSLDLCVDTLTLMKCSLTMFDRLNRFWASARVQSRSIQRRCDQLTEIMYTRSAMDRKAWKFRKPLDSSFSWDQDVFYGSNDTGSKSIYEHVGISAGSKDILLVD